MGKKIQKRDIKYRDGAKQAVIYTRVSTDDQVHGYSLKTQEEECLAYAERRGFHVIKVFVGEGESAKTLDRPALQEMLAYIDEKKNGINAVIFYKIERLSRNNQNLSILRLFLEKRGIELVSVTEPIDDTPIGQLNTSILGAYAQYENDIKAERTRNGMVQALFDGRWVGPPMVGYRFDKDAEGKSNLAPDENAEYIRRAFELCATGKYKSKEIVEILQKEGFTGIYKQWLHKILRRPIYCGIMVHGVYEKPVKGKYEPLISEEEFYLVQDILDGKSHTTKPRNRNNPNFPLRNFVKCPYGKPLTGSSSRGRNRYYDYYHHTADGCELKSIPKEKLEGEFVELLARLKPKESMIVLFGGIVEDVYRERKKEALLREVELKKQIRNLTERKQKTFDAFINDKIGEDIYKEQIERIEQEINEKKHEAMDLSCGIEEDISDCSERCKYFFSNLDRLWAGGDIDLRQRFQQIIFPEGICYDGNEFIGTDKKSCIFQLLDPETCRTSTLAPREGLEPPT